MNFTITRKSRFWAEKRQGSDVTDSQTEPSQTDNLLPPASLDITSPLKIDYNSRIDQSLLTRSDLADSKSLVDNSSSASTSDLLKFSQSPVRNSTESLRKVRRQFQHIIQVSSQSGDTNETMKKRELKRPSALHLRKPYFLNDYKQNEGIQVVPEEEKEYIRSRSVSEEDYSFYDDNISSAFSASASCADEDDSDPGDDEENMDPLRQLRRRRLRKVLYASYFIGVAISLQNRIRLYGTLKPIDKVQEAQPEINASIKNRFSPLMPSDPIRITWTIILAIFSFVTAIITPYQISFLENENDILLSINIILDIVFGIDIIINFISAYYDPIHGLVTDTKTIRSQYFSWWFWLDFLSIIPLHLAMPSTSSFRRVNKLLRVSHMSRLSRWFKLLRLFYMLKLSSTSKIFNKLIKKLNLNQDLIKMLKFAFNIALLNHFAGCFLFFLAKLDGFGPETWVAKGRLVDEESLSQYLTAYSWALQTITTVGFGDVEPQTPLERLTAILWMIMGVGVYSFTIENLSLILINSDRRESALKKKISIFNNFASKSKLPDFLRKKVQRFFELNHKENVYYWLDPNDMLKHLPEGLKGTLLLYSYHVMIRNIEILEMNANFTAALLLHLKLLKLEKREILYREGDPSQEIYFISKGSVKMVNEFGQGIYTLVRGTYFGELELLQDTKRLCFAQACETTIVIVCDKEVFMQTLKSFPDVAEKLNKVAKYREDKLQTNLKKLKEEASENIVKGNKKPLLSSLAYFNVLLGEKNKIKKRQRSLQKKESASNTKSKENILNFLAKTTPKETGQEKSFQKLSDLAISLRKHKSDDNNPAQGKEQMKRFIKRSGIKKSLIEDQGSLDPSGSQTNNSFSLKTESQPITLVDFEQKQISEEVKKDQTIEKAKKLNNSRFTQIANKELNLNNKLLTRYKSSEENYTSQYSPLQRIKGHVNLPPIKPKTHFSDSSINQAREGLKINLDLIEEPNSATKLKEAYQGDNSQRLLQSTEQIKNLQHVQKGLGEIRKLREMTESILSEIGVKEENVIAEFMSIAERQKKLNANVDKLFSMFRKST